jgi:WD40 repeat protein
MRIRWQLEYFVRIPLIGSSLLSLSVNRLLRRCKGGDVTAAKRLAEGLELSLDGKTRAAVVESLEQVTSISAISGMWETWARTRNTQLSLILEKIHQTAEINSPAHVISMLKLGFLLPIRNEGANSADALIQLIHDRQAEIVTRANEATKSLKNQAAVDRVCLRWTENRSLLLLNVIRDAGYQARKPVEVKVLVALKLNRLEAVIQGDEQIVPALIKACDDSDPEISQPARACLLNLQNQKAVNEICRFWSDQRSPLLENAIQKAAYLPDRPYALRLLTALKTDRLELARQSVPEGLEILLNSIKDSDSTIAKSALEVLRSLSNQATIDELCERVINQDDLTCKQLALETQYQPQMAERRALFLFLTEQQAKYEELDFDHRIMQAIYTTASPDLKNKIARQVQLTGKTADLAILAGIDLKSNGGLVSSKEIELLVRILSQNQEWERLWDLVFELPLTWSIEVVRTLAAASWQPAAQDELTTWQELARRASADLVSKAEDLGQLMPPALQRATLQIHGRINDLCFARNQNLLMIGTGQRKLGLWDYQKGAMQRTIGGFSHSISQITFCGEYMLCGQRSNKDALCSIYGWLNDQSFLLGSHKGAVTTLTQIDDRRVLSTGRDGRVIVWDLETRKLLSEATFDFWSHAAAISPDRRIAALVHQGLTLINLSDLEINRKPIYNHSKSEVHRSSATSVEFTPEGDGILVGQHNGQVVYYDGVQKNKSLKKELVINHLAAVVGLQFIPRHPIFVSCSMDGAIRFTSWPDQRPFGTKTEVSQSLTSLHVSPDGSFLATGTRDARIMLWDLRVLDLPGLFSTPVGLIKPGQAAAIQALLEENGLPLSIRNTLEFFSTIIQHRFKFDVEIGEAPMLAKGEFDVIID